MGCTWNEAVCETAGRDPKVEVSADFAECRVEYFRQLLWILLGKAPGRCHLSQLLRYLEALFFENITFLDSRGQRFDDRAAFQSGQLLGARGRRVYQTGQAEAGQSDDKD